MGKVVSVISGKDKMGKTTVAAAVSSCLAMLKNKTLCVDFGTGPHNIKHAFNISKDTSLNYIELFKGQGKVIESCYEHPLIRNLSILSIPGFDEPENLDVSTIKPMFEEIRNNFDYCIIDTPSIYDNALKFALADADMALIITTGESTEMTDVQKAGTFALDAGVGELRLIINRILPGNNEEIKMAAEKVFGTVGAKLIGKIPEDEFISKALLKQNPLILWQKHELIFNFIDIARFITGKAIALKKRIQPLPPVPPAPLIIKKLDNNEQPDDPEVSDDQDDYEYELLTPEIISRFMSSFGDPDLWARSTLLNADINDLIPVYAISEGMFMSKEEVRNRMWLHDLLDDNNILYYIEMDGVKSGKALADIQRVFVEKKNAQKAFSLIKTFNDSESIVSGNPVEENDTIISDDGIPQKLCPSCNEHIDFDYYKCPYCKQQVD